ncbi:MAG: DUF58 domain-containing protein [Phycisphaerales bacterium]|nr:MAG: DUF58 domain-containing protein [Phycisphaerales bacterium]
MPTLTQPQADALLDPEFMQKLDQLELVSRKIFAGKMRGERRSKRKGESVEFADYRNYVVGDDLRFVDWNIFARLNKLFLKLFLEEEDLHVSFLIDTSKSMDWGHPSKSLYARRVAAALGYIGLVNYDRVSFYAYSSGLQYEMTGVRGRRFMFKVLDFLVNTECDGTSDLSGACRQFAIRHPQQGIVIVLSDFFEKGGFETGLRYLLGRKYDIYCIQMLSPEEIDPPLVGDLQLRDVEDADLADVTVSRALLNRYKQNLQGYCAHLKDFCTKRGISYMFTSTEVPFDQVVLTYFRKRGLIQ